MIFIHLEDGASADEKERSYGSIMMERLTGSPDGRIDHVLQVIKFCSTLSLYFWLGCSCMLLHSMSIFFILKVLNLNSTFAGENISAFISICSGSSYVSLGLSCWLTIVTCSIEFQIFTDLWMSCSNYWRDHDTALFILKHLYRDIPEDPPSDVIERMPVKLFYERDPVEEETPVTFSDHAAIKEFCRKLRAYSRKMEDDANCQAS